MRNYLADNIRFLRRKRGLTQDELGKAIGKIGTTIGNYETGYRTPSIEDLRALGDLFHVPTDKMIREDLSMVTDFDAEAKANWLCQEVLRLRLSDKEFEMLESYIKFIVSQRS